MTQRVPTVDQCIEWNRTSSDVLPKVWGGLHSKLDKTGRGFSNFSFSTKTLKKISQALPPKGKIYEGAIKGANDIEWHPLNEFLHWHFWTVPYVMRFLLLTIHYYFFFCRYKWKNRLGDTIHHSDSCHGSQSICDMESNSVCPLTSEIQVNMSHKFPLMIMRYNHKKSGLMDYDM